MRNRWLVVSALGLTACRDLLGFEDPSATSLVTFRLTREHLQNNDSHLPVEIAQAPSLAGVTVRLADGTQPDLTLTAAGAIAFRVPVGESYRLGLTQSGQPLELQTASTEPVFDDLIFGREDSEPVPSNTVITYSGVPLDGTYSVMSTGVWMAGPAVAGTMGADLSIDWSSSFPISFDRAGLVTAAANDQLHLAHFATTGSGATAFTAIDQIQSNEIEMIGGSTTLIATTELRAVNTRSSTFDIDPKALDTVLSAVPNFSAVGSGGWSITILAAPSLRASETGFGVASAGSSTDYDPRRSTLTYPDRVFPYPLVAALGISRGRAGNTPDGPSLGLNVSIFHLVEIVPETDTYDLKGLRVGLPDTISFGSTALITDNAVIELDPAGGATLSWPAVDDADVFHVQIVERLAANNIRNVRAYLTAENQVSIEPEVFVPGRLYVVSLVTVRGVPGARDGDFATRTMPFGSSRSQSATFSVVPAT
jgi:hypothetical protein